MRERRTSPGFGAFERFLSALGTFAVGTAGERRLAVVLAGFYEYFPSIRRALPQREVLVRLPEAAAAVKDLLPPQI